jgi:hypothetical protein
MFEFVPIIIGMRSLENQESVRMTDLKDKRNEEIGHSGQTLVNHPKNTLKVSCIEKTH